MGDPVQLKKGYQWRIIPMKDGTGREVMAKDLNKDFFVYEEDGAFWLTHTKTGGMVTSGRTQKSLRELLQEPEFFEEPLSSPNLAKAINRWGNRHNWNV